MKGEVRPKNRINHVVQTIRHKLSKKGEWHVDEGSYY